MQIWKYVSNKYPFSFLITKIDICVYIYLYIYIYLYSTTHHSTPMYWALFYVSQNFTLYIYLYISSWVMWQGVTPEFYIGHAGCYFDRRNKRKQQVFQSNNFNFFKFPKQQAGSVLFPSGLYPVHHKTGKKEHLRSSHKSVNMATISISLSVKCSLLKGYVLKVWGSTRCFLHTNWYYLVCSMLEIV